MTSNPTIFEKAIVSSGDYEDALRKLVADGRSTIEIYEQLAIEDIRGACDLMLPLFQESGGVDGRISLEVLPELATATDKTVAEGLRLAAEVGRPNVMIKVPATPEGIPAIRALTAKGISVNVTLIFSLLQYEEVVEAYLAGLEDRVAAGGKLDGLASVASFFVSRVDSVCDKLLKEKAAAAPELAARCEALLGKLAIANAKMAYEIYERTIAAPRWAKLAAAGALPQRLLWASTGTKDPRYPDTYYVDALLGRRHRRHGAARDAGRLPRSRQAGGAHQGRPRRRQDDGGGVRGGRPRPVARLPRPARRRREVVHHVDEDAARRGRRPARRAARVRRRAARGSSLPDGAAAGDATPRVARAGEGPRAGRASGRRTRRSSPATRRTSGRSRAASAGCARRR